MKTLIATAASAVLAIAIPVLAGAQTAPTGTTFYGSLGYAAGNVDGYDLGALQGRLGARFGQHFGVEGELSGGVSGDKTSIGGVPVKVDLQNQAAIYGVGYLPLTPNFDLLARVGYGDIKIKASTVNGVSAAADGGSWNYGVGGQYHFDDKNAVRADYTRHDFQDSGANADVWSVAYVRTF
jgi:outer membrane immunogenic protein